jgi:uncharacterized protein (UPF0333 family)
MPTYDFKNKKTGEYEEHTLRMSEYDQFIEDHPELQRVILTAPQFNYQSHTQGSVTDLAVKKDKGWKEVLQKIGEQNPISQVAEDHNQKSIKQVKTQQVIEKHVKKQEARKKEIVKKYGGKYNTSV